MTLVLSYFGIAAMSAFLGGLVGLGGGFLLIPLLTIGLLVPIRDAIFLSLLALLWMGLLKMHQNRVLVRAQKSLVLKLGAFTALGSASSVLLGARLSADFLNILFSLILVIVGTHLLIDRHWHPSTESESREHPSWLARLMFLASGSLGGLLGLGGGILNVPVLHRLLKFPMAEATKLNFPFIFLSALIALMTMLQTQRDFIDQVPVVPALALLTGTTLGSVLSGRVHFSGKALKVFFAILMLVLGIIKFIKTTY